MNEEGRIMNNIYCKTIEDGITDFFQVISFLSVAQFHPYSVRAICLDMHGNLSTPAVEQITIVSKDDIPVEYYNTVIDL